MIFVLFLCVSVSVFPEADSQTEKKPNYLDLKATSCSINVVTASHKKLENVVLQMKRKLDEIQMDIRNLTQIANKNNKGKTERLENVHFLFFSINGLGLLLRCWFRKSNEYLYDLMFLYQNILRIEQCTWKMAYTFSQWHCVANSFTVCFSILRIDGQEMNISQFFNLIYSEFSMETLKK